MLLKSKISEHQISLDPKRKKRKRTKKTHTTFLETIETLNANRPEGCRLTAIEYLYEPTSDNNHNVKQVVCKCSCGNRKTIPLAKFKSGHTRSCGCLQAEELLKRVTKYYPVVHEIRRKYYNMMSRCHDTNHVEFKNYGGRGVSVCKEWVENYQNFLNWSLANGWESGLELDKDIKGNGLLYSPETCSWVTRSKNQNSKRCCKKYLYNGELLSTTEIANETGISRGILYHRIRVKKISMQNAIALGRIKKIYNPRNKNAFKK